MGLHPWDKICIQIKSDDFDVVLNNIEYMKKRLECEIELNLNCNDNKKYEDEDNGKSIKYFVKLL